MGLWLQPDRARAGTRDRLEQKPGRLAAHLVLWLGISPRGLCSWPLWASSLHGGLGVIRLLKCQPKFLERNRWNGSHTVFSDVAQTPRSLIFASFNFTFASEPWACPESRGRGWRTGKVREEHTAWEILWWSSLENTACHNHWRSFFLWGSFFLPPSLFYFSVFNVSFAIFSLCGKSVE